MARQSTKPVEFTRRVRPDACLTMSSARAGVVVPCGYIPLLAGDSASGKVAIDIQLKEMPKPLLNGVVANFQAWFVPKESHPQFSGRDELNHARTGQTIKALRSADRTPPLFFNPVSGASKATAEASLMFKTLGIHNPAGVSFNDDLIDAFVLIYNFRLAAHSSKLARRKYASEDIAEATALPPAFWPSSRLGHVVPDYEKELVVGALDLDVLAGRMPLSGFAFVGLPPAATAGLAARGTFTPQDFTTTALDVAAGVGLAGTGLVVRNSETTIANARPYVFAEMAGQQVTITTADIDMARTTQAFAKLRSAYNGNDTTGFDNDDTIVALLMEGIAVPAEQFKRPWLLDSKRVPVGFSERFATDAANLDDSVTLGRATASLSLNVPKIDMDGIIIFTVEVLPERLDERMTDEWLLCTHPDHLPNPLRDVQRVLPVDFVYNRRVDAKHSAHGGVYGHEAMNMKWHRNFTRLGGEFFNATPGAGYTGPRSGIWQTEIVNPTLSSTHYLAPAPFPHKVFADTLGDAFEFVCRHAVSISGFTQVGDVLVEDNNDFDLVEDVQ